MAKITRRGFLALAGTGAAGLAFAKVGMSRIGGIVGGTEKGTVQFVAMGPLPSAKVSPIATLVVRGYAPTGNSAPGQVTMQVLPGSPATSDQPLPRMTRLAEVRAVRMGSTVRLEGRIVDVSNPSGAGLAGEFAIQLDPDAKTAHARIHGVEYPLELREYRVA